MKDSMVHQARTLAALTDISRHISSSLDYKKLAHQFLASLRENLELEKCALLMPNGDKTGFNVEAGTGWEEGELEKALPKITRTVVKPIFSSGMPIALLDASDISDLYIPSSLLRENPVVGFIGVPILVNQIAIGVLVSYRTSFRTMIDEDVNVMKIVASILSQTLKLADFVAKTNQKLRKENDDLHAELEGKFEIDNFISSSSSMNTTVEMMKKVSYTDATVLLRGESGTGKTLIAKGVHYNSQKKRGAFVMVNCAAIPSNLIESELFGHEKGAFTGAISKRIGRFEAAEGGTIFLDEIGDLSLDLQAKLLQVIQEKSYQRVGSNETLISDVRIICATNVNLEEAVQQKKFREDLYYRLMVVPVYLPSLKARKEDVLPLAVHFLKKFNNKYSKSLSLSKDAIRFLEEYTWPGNVRELENTIERSAILAKENELQASDISLLSPLINTEGQMSNGYSPPEEARVNYPSFEGRIVRQRAPYERVPIKEDNIRKALSDSVGIQTLAARTLGISLRQLRYAIKKYKLDVNTYKG